MIKIYISSLAFSGIAVEDMIQEAKRNNFAIEFSSGIPYRENMKDIFLQAEIKKIVHNYFPAPKVAFVLNLASRDNLIRNRSIEHCISGLRLSKQSGGSFFSAHAGFCIDPSPSELGDKLENTDDFDTDIHKYLFIDSLHRILKEAHELNMDFLIENNVIARHNLTHDGKNPLLMCESAEILWLFKEITDRNLGLLLDTAHLKVSCATLNKDLDYEFNSISTFIRAIHHSDNDGIKDTNFVLKNDYWFLKHMKEFNSIPHILEVKKLSVSKIIKQIKLLEKWL